MAPYLFLLPTVAMLFVFSIVPLLYGMWMSLYDFDIVHGRSTFVALQNYWRLLHDPQFGLSLLNTAWYTLSVVPLILVASIAIGVYLKKSTVARLIARVGFYVPFVLSPVVVATSWRWLLNEDLGVVDGFLKWFKDHAAREIASGPADNSEKIEKLGQLMFGEDWKD